MGVAPQQDNLDEELTTRQVLEVFARLYGVPRREQRGRRRPGAGHRHPHRPRGRAGRRAVRRHAPAAAHRPRAGPPAAAGAARRADGRARPAGPQRAVVAGGPAARRGRQRAHEHALHRGGRAPRRHGRRHGRRPGGRPRGARRPGRRARRAPRRSRCSARGQVLDDVVRARRRPGACRPAAPGPSVSVLRAEGLQPADVGADGPDVGLRRRAAVLEDVFVVLTGEEVE